MKHLFAVNVQRETGMVVEAELILWLHVVSLSCTIFHPQTWAELQESGGRAGGLPSPSALPSPRPLGLLVQASPPFPSGLLHLGSVQEGRPREPGESKNPIGRMPLQGLFSFAQRGRLSHRVRGRSEAGAGCTSSPWFLLHSPG